MHLYSFLPRLRAAIGGGCLVAGLLLSTAASAQWHYATRTTLDVAGVLVTPRDVVMELSGAITTSLIPGLPATARIVGVHEEGSATLFVSSRTVELPGAVFAERRDVSSLTGSTYALALDGSAAGVPPEVAIDGVSRNVSGHVLISIDTTADLAGVTGVDDADVVAWNGINWTTFFDASSASVPAHLDVDGLHYDVPGDAMLLSFDSAGQIDGIDFGREDILRFEFGGGGWSLELDASTTEPDLVRSDLVAVPEPTTPLGLLAGVLGLVAARRVQTGR